MSEKLLVSLDSFRWCLNPPVEVCTSTESPSTLGPDTEAVALMKTLFTSWWSKSTLKGSYSVTGVLSNSRKARALSSGNIVEIMTLKCASTNAHYPFVLKMNTANFNSANYATSIWYTEMFFCVTDAAGKEFLFCAVRPSQALHAVDSNSQEYYQVEKSCRISVVELDATMRTIPALHQCDPRLCFPEFRNGSFMQIRYSNGSIPLRESTFIPRTRRKGFPPRRD